MSVNMHRVFVWLHESFGTNWRMTEMQAVIGRIQLKRMPQWQAQRLANAEAIWADGASVSCLACAGCARR